MRIRRVEIERFGPLRSLDTGEAPLPGLTAILGPNEAGKSSFFLALRALVHGVYPASRDGNPWTPWDGEDLEIRGEFETRAGERYTVHRRLLSTPWGRLYRGDETDDIGNDAIPDARHLSRGVYEHVFTITLPQLAALRRGTEWKKVRDRLVVGMGGGDVASPREVAEALESRAERLWRPTRRGNPRDRQIREELEALSERLRDARERDRELRAVVRETAETRERLDDVRKHRLRLREHLARAREYLPLERRLEALARLHEEAGPADRLASVPPHPLERMGELSKTMSARKSALDEAERGLEAARARMPAEDPLLDGLAAHREEVRRLVSARPVAEDRRERLAGLKGELAEVDEEIRSAGLQLLDDRGLTAMLEDRAAESLAAIPLGEFRRRVRMREDATSRRFTAEEALRNHATRPEPDDVPKSMPGSGIAAVVVGGILVVVSAIAAATGATEGLFLFLLGGTGLIALLFGTLRLREWDRLRREAAREARHRRSERTALEARLDEVRASESEAAQGAIELLQGLPLRPERTETPDESLASEIEALRSLLGRKERLRRLADELGAADATLVEEVRALQDGLPDPALDALDLPPDPLRALVLLETLLGRVDEHIEARRGARESLARARDAVDGESSRMDEARQAFESLAHALISAAGSESEAEAEPPPGSPTDGEASLATRAEAAAREADRRMDALREAQRIERELTEAFGSPATVRRTIEEIRGRPELGGRSLEELEELLSAANEQESALRESLARLEADEVRLLDGETADRVEEEMVRLREEQVRVREERDRLWVLARVVRTAEREFREAHQPALIRRAERYLEQITAGRYTGLMLGDESDPDALNLKGPHLPGFAPVEEPISTGTREQVFLSLRLAILDLLEGDGEPLPLILDEALVNWDSERRGRCLDLFETVARSRQVFVFTCHPALADEVEARSGRVIRLPDVAGAEAPPAVPTSTG